MLSLKVNSVVCAKWLEEPCYWGGEVKEIDKEHGRVFVEFTDKQSAWRPLEFVRLVSGQNLGVPGSGHLNPSHQVSC
jgi:hypothetical protein